jgi:hypothetical protein
VELPVLLFKASRFKLAAATGVPGLARNLSQVCRSRLFGEEEVVKAHRFRGGALTRN